MHSWGQNLLFHPHIHCVATGGGISLDGNRWISTKPGFFLPVRVPASLFRRLFLEALEDAFQDNLLSFPGKIGGLKEPAAFVHLTASLRRIDWVLTTGEDEKSVLSWIRFKSGFASGQSLFSAGPTGCWNTSAATRIEWPSTTGGY